MTDYATARRHMVDGQVRPNDVTDLRVISAMLEIARERFVPPAAAALAYLDLDLALGEGTASSRRLLKPMVLAKLLNAADLKATDRVLVVGCATGYAAAVLAGIVREVVALEQDANLAKTARATLSSLPNVSVVSGPLVDGWPQAAPYDVILLEGATEVEPQVFRRQLKDGGRLLCIQGSPPGASATLYRRSGNEMGGRAIFEATAALLPGFEKKPEFAF
jgi:protein-L-isoaspartate(D-aspartate) O-methyltransferase